MKTYIGTRDGQGTAHVFVQTGNAMRALPLRLDIANHSPTGFDWGYAGSGPAQLALAILADALGNDERADWLHQAFKRDRIATLLEDFNWQMTVAEVLLWVEKNRVEEQQERATP